MWDKTDSGVAFAGGKQGQLGRWRAKGRGGVVGLIGVGAGTGAGVALDVVEETEAGLGGSEPKLRAAGYAGLGLVDVTVANVLGCERGVAIRTAEAGTVRAGKVVKTIVVRA